MKSSAAVHRILMHTVTLALMASTVIACSSTSTPEIIGIRQVTTSIPGFPLISPSLDESLDVVSANVETLAGPHFRLDVDWTATGDQLSQSDAERLGTSAVRARVDEQLLIVAIDPSRSFVSSSDAAVIVSIVVNGEPIELQDILSLPGDVPQYNVGDAKILILSFQRDVEVRLNVSDAGRDSEILLPSGTIAVGDDSYSLRTFDAEWDDQILVTEEGRAVRFRASGPSGLSAERSGRVRLTNYVDGQGWAFPGRAFLQVALPDLTDANSYVYLQELVLEDSEALAFLSSSSNLRVAALPAGRRIFMSNLGVDPLSRRPEYATFDVPQNDTAGSIELSLEDAMLFRDDRLVDWVVSDEPLTMQIGFS